MITQNKRLIGILLSAGLVLLIPLAAMQFTREVNWTPFDFIVAGGLLFGIGLLLELVIRKVKKTGHRIAISIALLVAFILVWLELAVGIFGSPLAGN